MRSRKPCPVGRSFCTKPAPQHGSTTVITRGRSCGGATSPLTSAPRCSTPQTAGSHMDESQRPWIVRKANRTRLWAWMPYGDGKNRAWLKGELGRIQPEWNKAEQRWEIARKHLWVLAEALAEKFGEVELTLEFNKTEKCNPSCQNAVNDVSECVCSCLGEFHGGRGEPREWIRSGAHTLISKGPTHTTYLIVHRREPILETIVPEPEPAVPPQLPESTPRGPTSKSVPLYATGTTDSTRDPTPPPGNDDAATRRSSTRLRAGCVPLRPDDRARSARGDRGQVVVDRRGRADRRHLRGHRRKLVTANRTFADGFDYRSRNS
ncbi:MAG: hypothetical protein JWN03_3093 [Nocardia sp.]|nr:hypothetical protein [Nocardia sp.]